MPIGISVTQGRTSLLKRFLSMPRHRGASRRADEAARELTQGSSVAEPGKERLLATRRVVVRGWREIGDQLVRQGQLELAI